MLYFYEPVFKISALIQFTKIYNYDIVFPEGRVLWLKQSITPFPSWKRRRYYGFFNIISDPLNYNNYKGNDRTDKEKVIIRQVFPNKGWLPAHSISAFTYIIYYFNTLTSVFLLFPMPLQVQQLYYIVQAVSRQWEQKNLPPIKTVGTYLKIRIFTQQPEFRL